MKESTTFMGFDLPENISFEVFINYVQFYKKNVHDEWNPLGMILIPYEVQPLPYWKKELDLVLTKA